jgi:hypothetical protein
MEHRERGEAKMLAPFGTRLVRTETAIPASVIASVSGDRIALSVGIDEVKQLERGVIRDLGPEPAR